MAGRRAIRNGATSTRVRRTLVVVGEALGACAHRERAAGDRDPVVAGGGRDGTQRRLARGQHAAELHRLAHRLGVLELVADHHLVKHRVGCAVLERAQDAGADGVEVIAGRGRVEQLDLPADGARRLERVVHRGELRVQQRLAREAMHEPQVLVGRNVGKVPHERAHDRVDLALELGDRQMADELQGAAAGRVHGVEDLVHGESVTVRASALQTVNGREPPSAPEHRGAEPHGHPWGYPYLQTPVVRMVRFGPRRHSAHSYLTGPPTFLKEQLSARQHVRCSRRPLERAASQDGHLGLDRLRGHRLRHRRRRRRQEADRLHRPRRLGPRRPARPRPLPEGRVREHSRPGAEGRLREGRERPQGR